MVDICYNSLILALHLLQSRTSTPTLFLSHMLFRFHHIVENVMRASQERPQEMRKPSNLPTLLFPRSGVVTVKLAATNHNEEG
jgi:hypothetical protein